jgi:hypothetical protein
MIILLIVILFVFLICKLNNPTDPFKYIWDLALLDQKYLDLQKKQYSSIDKFYRQARWRIEEGLKKADWFSEGFFSEVEHIMKTRRSLDILLKRTWKYAKELAGAYGYNEEEVNKEGFCCPGWDNLWKLYHHHKERILLKKSPRNNFSHSKSNSSDSFHSSSNHKTSDRSYSWEQKNHHDSSSFDSVKSKNQKIFHGIYDLNELKKKYYRLAKLNHPDCGGSVKAMKLLNEYYQEALQKILSKDSS